MRCLQKMIITEILRLKEMHLTLREIGESVGCSKTTASEILSRCKECGLSYESAVSLPPERIQELIYSEIHSAASRSRKNLTGRRSISGCCPVNG